MKKLKQKYREVKATRDGMALLSNFGYLSLLQIAGYIFPLATLPYLSKVIGVENFGKIAFASAVVVWFQTVADWGFNYTATRDIAQNRDDQTKVSEIFSNVFWARIALMVLSFGLLLAMIAIVPIFRNNSAIILLSFLTVPAGIMFPDWFFQALERMKYITILNLFSKFLFTITIFVFIKEKSDYMLQPLLTSVGAFFSGLIAMYYIIGRWGIKLHKPHTKAIIQTIKSSTDVFINNLIPNIYYSFSTLLLGYFGGNTSNGLLDAGNKFIAIAQQFLTVIARTFFPFLARRLDKHQVFVKLNVFVSLFFSILLFLLAPYLIKIFFTNEFHNSILIIRIMAFSIFLITIRNTYGTHYLLLKGYEKELRNLTFLGSIVGFLISFPLIYFYDYIGAAVTIIIAQFIMAISVVYKALQIQKSLKV